MLKLIPHLLLTAFISCTTRKVNIPLPPLPLTGMKTPELILPKDADEDMKSASKIFHAYANADEFYTYVRSHVTKLEFGNETNVGAAITKYRACLAGHEAVSIVFKNYSKKNRNLVYGGWRKTYLAQNRYKELNAIDRSAHWVHELAHMCGFSHEENDIKAYPNITRSWPYQIGNAFKAFMMEKISED